MPSGGERSSPFQKEQCKIRQKNKTEFPSRSHLSMNLSECFCWLLYIVENEYFTMYKAYVYSAWEKMRSATSLRNL